MNGYSPCRDQAIGCRPDLARASNQRVRQRGDPGHVNECLRLAVRLLRLAQPAATTLPVVPDYWRCIPTAGLIHQYPAWSVQVFNHIAAQVVTDQVRPQSAVASCCSVRVTSPIYSVDYQLFLRLAPGSPRGWTNTRRRELGAG